METLQKISPAKLVRGATEWYQGNPRQTSVSNKKDSTSNAVPLCLPNNYIWDSVTKKISVDTTKPRKTLKVCTEGLKLLESLKDQLVVVLCIAGPARSGKSFLASLIQDDVTFDVGHDVVSHTTGIWIGVGAKTIRVGNDEARLVILDAEGLGGISSYDSTTDAKWEHKIFSLCVLLSSYVIYNSKGPPNNDQLDKLGFIVEFSRSICRERQEDVDKQQTPSEGFGWFSPDFLWIFRDVLFVPKLKKKKCNWTEFVQKTLLAIKPNEPARNNVRKSILSTFTTIRAADLPPPTLDSNAIQNLKAEENEDKINKDFFPGIKKVVNTILSSVQIKNIQGSNLTGQLLIDMLSQVADTVNSECDKLDVTSMWNGIVNTQMQRYVQSALDLYKKKMEKAELPEEKEAYVELHKTAKASSMVHFEEVTTRFEKDISSSQLQVLCDKIELEFLIFWEKNEQASLTFNNKMIADLENEYFKKLPAKPTCMQLKIAYGKFNDCYNTAAKGPKGEQVKRETQLQRDQKIGSIRTESLIYAELQSCELFENSLKVALEGQPLSSSQLNTLKETCVKDCFNNFRKTSCNEVDCTPCMKSEQSLGRKVESIFKNCSSECYDKSEKACQCLINELIKRILLPFVKNIGSHNYSDFVNIKDEILTQYDIEAKGPAKTDLVGTCIKTIDMQKEGIQLLIIQSALKSVYCKYKKSLIETAKSDPCEAEELEKTQALKRKDMISAFKVKCEGIDKSTVKLYELNLEDLIKNFTTWIANENKRRSINVCEKLATRFSREFNNGILQRHIPEILRETEYNQCSDHLQKAEKFKHKILNDYEQEARGPEKERFQQILNDYLETHLIIVKEAVNEMILKTVLQNHFAKLDTIKQKYPISETELQSAISETFKNTEKVFIDLHKHTSLPFDCCSKDTLSMILNLDPIKTIEENYKESTNQLDIICKDISLESKKKCEKLVVCGGEVDTVKFAKIKDDCAEEFEKSGKGVLKDHYRSILQDSVDLAIRDAQTSIAENRVKCIFANFRTAIENLVQRNPRELEKDIQSKNKDAREKIEKLQHEVAEANMTVTDQMLKIELKDTISYVDVKNLHISSEKCYEQLREDLEQLKDYCRNILASETSVMEYLRNFEATLLRKYEEVAIGPAKADERKKLEKEIVEEVERMFVKFAKAKYRQILRKEIEQFAFKDLLNNELPVNIEQLVEVLSNKVDNILKTYPTLGTKTKDDLTRELEKSIKLSLLNELITAYENKITQLTYRDILKEDELTNELHTAKRRLIDILILQILENDDALPESINVLERTIKLGNEQRSRIYCQQTFDTLFHCNWKYLTKEYFKKIFDEKCKGPAKETVWNENEETINTYYNSSGAYWRKLLSPIRYLSHLV